MGVRIRFPDIATKRYCIPASKILVKFNCVNEIIGKMGLSPKYWSKSRRAQPIQVRACVSSLRQRSTWHRCAIVVWPRRSPETHTGSQTGCRC